MIDIRKNRKENEKLCKENPESFMICPRCNGTKITQYGVIDFCDYCNGNGVISWIDRITRNMKNPFLDRP